MVLCAVVLVIVGVMWIRRRKSLSEERKKILGVLVGAAMFGIIQGIAESQSPVLLEGNLLERNKVGDGSYEEALQLSVDDGGESLSYLVEVPEQILTREEEQEYLAAAREEIAEEFPGTNASMDCVRERVVIRESYQGGKVTAEWSFDNYEIMDLEGRVIAEEIAQEGELVKASVELSCGDSNSLEEFYFQVFSPIFNEQETMLRQLQKLIEVQGEKAGEVFLRLPEQIGEHQLSWKEKRDYTPEQILIFGGILAGFIPLLEQSRKQEQQKKRNCLLEMEYPDMVSKMALLLSSGMTLQGAWRKIALSYEEKRRNHTSVKMPAYEEMLIACREMESGMGEQRAYERFGERCQLAGYRKFSNILTQNLKKGTQGIVELLEQEADNAIEERKNAAKRYGEEAGTKLLFPMIIMLGIVIVILMVPAISAFQL